MVIQLRQFSIDKHSSKIKLTQTTWNCIGSTMAHAQSGTAPLEWASFCRCADKAPSARHQGLSVIKTKSSLPHSTQAQGNATDLMWSAASWCTDGSRTDADQWPTLHLWPIGHMNQIVHHLEKKAKLKTKQNKHQLEKRKDSGISDRRSICFKPGFEQNGKDDHIVELQTRSLLPKTWKQDWQCELLAFITSSMQAQETQAKYAKKSCVHQQMHPQTHLGQKEAKRRSKCSSALPV